MYKIGLYEREITPLFGNSIWGYFNLRLVDGVKEKTYAKAVVIEKGETIFAMVSVDACAVGDELIATVRERVNKYTGIKKENVTVAATHSHTAGPCIKDEEGADNKLDALYIDWLAAAVADTVVLAYQRRENMNIKLSVAEVEGISFVRNYLLKNGVVRTNPGVGNPDIIKPYGEKDNDAPVLLFINEKGEKVGMMYSFALHQDSVDGTEVSGDWSCIVSKLMKEKFGAEFISVFFYGTAGNINQVDVNSTDPNYNMYDYKRYGKVVFDAIIKSLDSASALDGDISVICDTNVYSMRVPDEKEISEQEEIFNSVVLPEGCKLDACSPKAYFDACMAKRALKHTFTVNSYYEVKFSIVKIGKVMIFALPGEVFSQYGAMIKKAFPNNVCLFACLANNKWSYMPTKDCYLPQLYESLYGSALFYPDDTEDIFKHFIELGKKLDN